MGYLIGRLIRMLIREVAQALTACWGRDCAESAYELGTNSFNEISTISPSFGNYDHN